jgi:hypothetical protein
LAEFVSTQPKEVLNRGYGKKSVIFATVSSPAFLEIARTVTVEGKKTVTTTWANQLDWAAIAYWYMDDGSCGARRSNCVFHTQGFSKAECEILSSRLKELGIYNKVTPVKNKNQARPYYVLCLTAESSRKLALNIAPWVHPSMRYKIPRQKETVICSMCGSIFSGRKDQLEAKEAICKKEKCKKLRHRKLNLEYRERKRAAKVRL